MADNSSLGEYKVIVSADYNGLISSMNAITQAVQQSSEQITTKMSAMTDGIGKSMREMAASTRTAAQQSTEQMNTLNQSMRSIDTAEATNSINKLGNGTNNLEPAFNKATTSANAFSSAMNKIKSHVEWMATATIVGGLLAIPVEGIHAITDIEQRMAGMKQVIPELQNNQEKLNQTTQEFISIASQYGMSIDDITESAKLWGRAYKDVATVENLLHSSSILAVADSFSMTEANKALEATMMQFGIRARTAAEATQYSMKIVDSWTNVAHNAIVSAQDLAAAN